LNRQDAKRGDFKQPQKKENILKSISFFVSCKEVGSKGFFLCRFSDREIAIEIGMADLASWRFK
jgi:hypothetical protein